jgi:dihydroxy-acid dehydratase
VRDGDPVTIDIDARELSVDLSDEEIERRVAAYEPPEPAYETGVMAKYAASVGSASLGALTV